MNNTDCRLCEMTDIRIMLPINADNQVAVCPICDLGVSAAMYE